MCPSVYAWIDALPPYRKVLLREQLRRSSRWEFLHETLGRRGFWVGLFPPADFRFLRGVREGVVFYAWVLVPPKVCLDIYSVWEEKP